MKTVIIIIYTFLVSVISFEDETELKVNYYEKLIEDAIEKARNYKLPTDNGAYFRKLCKNIEDFGTFDFIVVGAGSSGSVVASRLSEVEGFKILLLEAGGWDDDLTAIPYFALMLQLSERNWGYYTTPQRNGCYGKKGKRCSYARGKLIGGTGSINGMLYARGNKADYDEWASMGNPGWSFEDVLPYFKKLENYESDDIDLNYRGFAGPVNTVMTNSKEHFDILSESLIGMSSDILNDYNAKQQIGSSLIQQSTEYSRRVSGATAYVRPANSRHNFNVTVNALVTKILINENTKTAYGVEFIKDGQMYRATAKREVILSAGAFNTPQLLMLSGIGPRNELRKHAIPIIQDLPVGKELKDHYTFTLSYKFNHSTKHVTVQEAIREYLNGRGVLGLPANGIGITFVNTRNASSPVPNIEIGFYSQSPLHLNLPSAPNNIDQISKYNQQLSSKCIIRLYLLHPKSSGTLKLKSSRIIDFPLIDSGIFEDKDDLETFYEGIQFITELEIAQLAEKYNAQQIKFEVCDEHSYNSKDYWFCFLKYTAIPALHASTTAKMAPKSDPYAVVDHKLRVYGVKGLRVADCSIMPTQISGHNNAPAFMIGEKAADMIKSDNVV